MSGFERFVGKTIGITFFDINEAERVARIVEIWNPANPDLVPWKNDVVDRMRRQIDVFAEEDRK